MQHNINNHGTDRGHHSSRKSRKQVRRTKRRHLRNSLSQDCGKVRQNDLKNKARRTNPNNGEHKPLIRHSRPSLGEILRAKGVDLEELI